MTLFPTQSNKGRTAALLGGMGIGAALMYMLDPGRGARRRAVARDKAARFARVAGERIGKRSRDLKNRARGLAAEIKPSRPEERASDDVLEARARTEIGRLVRNPGAIHVAAGNGRVTLTGPVLESEREMLVSSVESVDGVEEVEDRLEPHEGAEDVSALQGTRKPRAKADRGQSRLDPESAGNI